MTAKDNWGWKARFGMFIVSSEAVPEAEWWAMLPPDVSVHAARVAAPAPWASWNAERNAVQLSADLARGAEHFRGMRLSAVVLGHSSSSLVGGAGWDAAVVAALSEILGPEIAVTTNALDCFAALEASGVERPFLVFPPWFNDATLEKGLAYMEAHGIAPSGHLRHDPGPGWREVPCAEMYPRGLGFEQQIEPLYAQIRAACPKAADGVLILGSGFRCVGIVEALERDLARPVITANQASLWQCLKRAGVKPEIEGYGRLLRL
ncbi:maleate cis-trans isomerase family protein [Nisaea sp.]|uniref:maleate cis-trans isomerase family protein n=1 Tax=Nisaea sp. TaxID=2024842 RepID=UPI003B51E573